MNATLFLTCFFIYIIGMIVFGWWVTRKKQSGDDFLLGGRRLPLFLTLGTTVATMVGTGSSMGAVGKAYQNGWMGCLYGVGGAFGLLVVAWLFAPARRHRFMTMSEEIAAYVGANRSVMNFVAIFVYFSNVGWLGAHILGGGTYLNFVTGLDLVWAKIYIALGFGIYSVIGGYRAVVWTDTIQAVVLFIGFVLTAILAWQFIGGFSGMQETQAIQAQRPEGQMRILPSLSLAVVIAVGVMGGSSIRQRIYSGNSVGEIRKAFNFSGALYFAFALLPAIIGLAAFKANSGLENRDLAFPWMATEMLPVAVGIIVILAGWSATMSSASSDAITGVTALIRDVYQIFFGKTPAAEKVIPYSRIALVITTGLALAMALMGKSVIGYITDMIALFISGMAVAGLMGRLWPRYNSAGAIATLVASFLTAGVFIFASEWKAYWGNSVIPTVAVSTLVGIVVSLLTKPDELSHEEAIAKLASEREGMS